MSSARGAEVCLARRIIAGSTSVSLSQERVVRVDVLRKLAGSVSGRWWARALPFDGDAAGFEHLPEGDCGVLGWVVDGDLFDFGGGVGGDGAVEAEGAGGEGTVELDVGAGFG